MKKAREIKHKLDYWGIKRQWLADKMGVSKTLLSFWLNGSYDMPQNRINEAEQILQKIPMPK